MSQLKDLRRAAAGTLLALALCAAPAQAIDLRKNLTVHEMKNGMKVLIYPRTSTPTFAAVLNVDVGSSDEPIGQTGIAHMFEHMAFKGTTTVGTRNLQAELPLMEKMDDLADEALAELAKPLPNAERLRTLREEIRKLQEAQASFIVKDEFDLITSAEGASGMNASTSADFTTYYISMPSNRLELYLWLEADRMRNLVMREFYSERDVVVEERRQRTDDSAMGTHYEVFNNTMFNAHPYGRPTIGWASDIAYITRRQAEKFREKYYGPKSCTLVLVGDVEPKSAIALVEKYFGDWNDPGKPHRITTQEPPIVGERRVAVEFNAEPRLMMGWLKPVAPHPDDYVFEVLTSVLSGGRTSRLYRELVEKRQVAASVSASSGPGSKYTNAFSITATPLAPHTVEECEAAIWDVLKDVAANGVTERELQAALNQSEAQTLQAARSNMSLATYIAWTAVASNNPYELTDYMEKIRAVKSEDIQRVIAQYLRNDNVAVVTLRRPKNADGGANAR